MKTVYRSSMKRDGDLKTREEQNYINEIFRMIGIYQKYLKEYAGKESFREFYVELYDRNNEEFHFVNKGIQFIYPMLEQEGIHISKHNLRRLGRTFRGVPVVMSIYIDRVIEVCLNYIFSQNVLTETYMTCLYIDTDVAGKILFQYVLLLRLANRYQVPNIFGPLRDNLDNIEWR